MSPQNYSGDRALPKRNEYATSRLDSRLQGFGKLVGEGPVQRHRKTDVAIQGVHGWSVFRSRINFGYIVA